MATYCISDIHGNINLWCQIKDFINPKEDKLICLGDCADRGLDGWEIITDVLRGVHEGWITYVRGNHEQMLINALDDYINYDGMCVIMLFICFVKMADMKHLLRQLMIDLCLIGWLF